MLSRQLSRAIPRAVPRAFPAAQTRSLSLALDLDHKMVDNVPGVFRIQTYNKISPVGLTNYPTSHYEVVNETMTPNSHAIMIRSHKLKEEEVPLTVRCIARCGAGTNNVPVPRMTELGIPVFNTPGANANAVKELVLCGLLLASRKVVQGIGHMRKLGDEGLAKERVEKDKAMFGGQELKGKTLGVIGLGHIGAATARDAAALGMSVVGYDPGMSIENALKLPNDTKLVDSMKNVFATADYISLNIPYINKPTAEGGTHGIIGRDLLMTMKKDASILNFARGELVDSEALKDWFDAGSTGKYVSDFPDDLLYDHENVILIPHLGASTAEAEDAAATMAANTIKQFLENGTIVNSVNFPETKLEARGDTTVRMAIINENKTGVLANILQAISDANLNILQQVNKSRDNIAYNVIDVELDSLADGKFQTWSELQETLTMIDGVVSSRFMNDVYGTGYAKKVEGQYFV
ncbi:hypothetical protein TrCOL_g2871 [Triparma columacea]|uniref:phosphoglycerate dehydrogenase n=1 Tax=Triparma columacea TaxID=722753 RepID=A0A9W7GDY9_9STRA|nr:hypothetical protein TrCOL_g2871 [Triparma columacea]